MPRQVDHNLRREQLAAAVWQLARRSGINALTVRAVGQEAGWTSGVVQHYFSAKADLLRYAFDLAQQRAVDRLKEIAAAPPSADGLLLMLSTLNPVDPEIEAESEVWFAFLGLALADPDLREAALRGHREMLAVIAQQVDRAAQAGYLRPGLDPADIAAELLALADGMNLRWLFRAPGLRPDAFWATVERRLAELVP